MSEQTGESRDPFPTFKRMIRACLRWRGWRIGAYLLLGVILVGGVANVLGSIYYGGKVKAALEEIKAQGKPVTIADMIPPPVAPEDNAAPLYLQAADISNPLDPPLMPRTDRMYAERYADKDWYEPDKLAVLCGYVREDGRALELLEQATAKPECRFDVNWEDGSGALFPHYARMRELAKFLRIAAIEASRRGDRAEALERLRMGFVISRRTTTEPIVIAQLVAYGIDIRTLDGAQHVLPNGPVPEREAKRLIQELQGHDHHRAMLRALQGERVFIWDVYQLMARHPTKAAQALGSPDDARLSLHLWSFVTLLRHLFYGDQFHYLRWMTDAEDAVAMPWPGYVKSAHWTDDGRLLDVPRWAIITRMNAPVFTRTAQKTHVAIARRSLLQIALVLELHRQRHGKYPAALQELADLDFAAPRDPFTGDEFVYRREGARYLLYSIGPDMKDDGGEAIWYLQHPKSSSRERRMSTRVSGVSVPAGDIPWMRWVDGKQMAP